MVFTRQSNLPGVCACMCMTGQRVALPDGECWVWFSFLPRALRRCGSWRKGIQRKIKTQDHSAKTLNQCYSTSSGCTLRWPIKYKHADLDYFIITVLLCTLPHDHWGDRLLPNFQSCQTLYIMLAYDKPTNVQIYDSNWTLWTLFLRLTCAWREGHTSLLVQFLVLNTCCRRYSDQMLLALKNFGSFK